MGSAVGALQNGEPVWELRAEDHNVVGMLQYDGKGKPLKLLARVPYTCALDRPSHTYLRCGPVVLGDREVLRNGWHTAGDKESPVLGHVQRRGPSVLDRELFPVGSWHLACSCAYVSKHRPRPQPTARRLSYLSIKRLNSSAWRMRPAARWVGDTGP